MRIYRYVPLNEYVIQFLEGKGLYFSSPLGFNDPYDFDLDAITTRERLTPYATTRYGRTLRREALRVARMLRAINARFVDSDVVDRRATMRLTDDTYDLFARKLAVLQRAVGAFDASAGEEPEHRIAASWASLKRQLAIMYGVVCFSSQADQILMWSHYADRHRGIALEFETEERPIRGWKNFAYLPVSYVTERHIDVIEKGFHGAFLATLTTKGVTWAYEKEHRLITLRGAGVQPARLAAFTGVVLGSRFNENGHEQRVAFFNALAANQRRRAGVPKMHFKLCTRVPARFEVGFRAVPRVVDLQAAVSSAIGSGA